MAAERSIKGVTFYPEEDIFAWYQTLGYGQANREINRLLRVALQSGAGGVQTEADVRQLVEQLSKKVATIEKCLPPPKIAELTFTKPHRLRMGLQTYEPGKNSFKFMAHHHRNEDRDLKSWSINQDRVEGTLLTAAKSIDFVGKLQKGGTIKNKHGRLYPYGEIVNLKIVDERSEFHDFSRENDLLELLEILGEKQESPAKPYGEMIFEARRRLFSVQNSFEGKVFLCSPNSSTITPFKAKLTWQPGLVDAGYIWLVNMDEKQETSLMHSHDEVIKFVVDSGELDKFMRVRA
jgi:hypothetical protein